MRIVFMGTPAAAVPTLRRLIDDGHEIAAVYTQPDRPSGRGNKVTFSPVKEVATEHRFEIRQPLKVKTDEAFDEFRSFEADAAIVVAYGRILPQRWLDAFPHGAINVHFSLLPKYRGAAPVNWAIVNGERESGVTTMKMDAGLDTGDILLQQSIEIGSDETSIELMDRLATLGADLLSDTVRSIDTIQPRPQDHDAATLAPIMRRDDGLIDWTIPASGIVDRIRGFQPFPTAFSFLDGKRVTFWKGEAVLGEPHEFGSVAAASADELLIGCGGSLLKVLEIQPEGKRRMSIRDFLNGSKVSVGTRFGN
jgi:methionyl-tRNA formyltransferase